MLSHLIKSPGGIEVLQVGACALKVALTDSLLDRVHRSVPIRKFYEPRFKVEGQRIARRAVEFACVLVMVWDSLGSGTEPMTQVDPHGFSDDSKHNSFALSSRQMHPQRLAGWGAVMGSPLGQFVLAVAVPVSDDLGTIGGTVERLDDDSLAHVGANISRAASGTHDAVSNLKAWSAFHCARAPLRT